MSFLDIKMLLLNKPGKMISCCILSYLEVCYAMEVEFINKAWKQRPKKMPQQAAAS